jgi:hypothetical protein
MSGPEVITQKVRSVWQPLRIEELVFINSTNAVGCRACVGVTYVIELLAVVPSGDVTKPIAID